MEERIRPTKSGLFAIELLIAVGIFSLCAAICMGLFVRSEVMSQEAADLNRAVSAARSAAECYKAAGGDLEKTAELTGGGVLDAGTLFIEFDESWQPLPSGEAGDFELTIALDQTTDGQDIGYASALLEVKRYTRTGSEAVAEALLLWDIAALEVRP
ncbi:MAG: hypothetical protein HFF67_05835 [Oscillospiraceae bacterium]|nr:hypothetical protein [Oscillospiraceae bacterium]